MIIFVYIYKTIISDFFGCKDWERGLNNTSIDNNDKKYGCLIKIPKYCPYKIGKLFLDRNRYSSLDCSKKGESYRKRILGTSKSPFINEKKNRFSFDKSR